MAWNPLDPEMLAQEVHGAIGFGFLLAAYYRVLPFGGTWFYLSIAILLIAVLIKEAFWDPVYEKVPPQPFFWQGAEDFGFYVVGLVLGLAFVLL